MEFRVRTARHEDVATIVPWTTDTFDWGDYVPDRLPTWIDSPGSLVTVCVTPDDRPVAVAHTVMLSPTEAWLEAARVHPDFKRMGMASAMNREGLAWARSQGARVARLATEANNIPAQKQVEAIGYRHTSTWVAAWLSPKATDQPEGTQLRPAPAADVEPAWMSWGVSELARTGRELISEGWRFRRGRADDLITASQEGRLFQCPSGWIIIDQTDAEHLRSGWMSTSREEAPALLAALAGLSGSLGVVEATVYAPAVPWIVEAMARAGGEPEEVFIYTQPLGG